MKQLFLILALNLFVASLSVQASTAHVPSNIAYAIASHASSILNNLALGTTNEMTPEERALADIKQSYTDLAAKLDSDTRERQEIWIAWGTAATKLEQLNTRYAASLFEYRASITTMLSLNARLEAAIN